MNFYAGVFQGPLTFLTFLKCICNVTCFRGCFGHTFHILNFIAATKMYSGKHLILKEICHGQHET